MYVSLPHNSIIHSFKEGRFLIEIISLLPSSVYFHRALNHLYVHLDIWARISLFTNVNINNLCPAISS